MSEWCPSCGARLVDGFCEHYGFGCDTEIVPVSVLSNCGKAAVDGSIIDWRTRALEAECQRDEARADLAEARAELDSYRAVLVEQPAGPPMTAEQFGEWLNAQDSACSREKQLQAELTEARAEVERLRAFVTREMDNFRGPAFRRDAREALGLPPECRKLLGIPGAWPCVLLAGHEASGIPHRERLGEESTKIWNGRDYVEDEAFRKEDGHG